MKFKTYTVTGITQNDKIVPFIRLSGNWIQKLGIGINDKLILYSGEDTIVLTKATQEELNYIEKMKKMRQITKLKKEIKKLSK